jgi:hypothetical protein
MIQLSIFVFSDRTGPLTAFASTIGNCELLKNQFEWLVEREVNHLIHQNLRLELTKLEMFLR